MKRIVWLFVFATILFMGSVYAQTYTRIHYAGFESGVQGWVDGGADSDRSNILSNVTDTGAPGGSWSWHLQDNTATSITQQAFDFSGYDLVNVSWAAFYDNIEGTEALELRCDGTVLWHYEPNTLGTENQWLGDENQQTVTIYPQNCTFDSSVTVRFEAEFSADDDEVYLDGVNITGIVFPDAVFPTFFGFNESPLNGTDYSSGQIFTFNATVLSSNGTAGLEFNGVNYSASNVSAVFNASFSNLGAGNYSYYWWAYGNGSNNNYNTSSVRYYTVTKANPSLNLLLNGSTNNLSLVYGGQVNATAASSTNAVQLLRNGVNITAQNGQLVTLGVGSYNYTAIALENQNYSGASTSLFVVVTPAAGSVSLLLNGLAGDLTVSYPQFVNASASSMYGSLALLRDGVDVSGSNGMNVSLGAGYYNYTAVSAGDQNHSSASTTYFANVTKGNSILSLLLNGNATNLTIPYPEGVNASASASGGTLALFRNGVDVTANNGLNVSLGSGTYTYFANASGNENYTANGTGLLLSVNVTKAISVVHTFVNNSRANLTVGQGSAILLNGSLVSGIGNIELYLNGSLINQGNETLSNLTTFDTLGLFNITTLYAGDQNYTSSFETWFVNVIDTVSPQLSIIYPVNNSNYSISQTAINYTVNDTNLAFCWYTLNEGVANTSIACGNTITGILSSEGSNTWRVYANDTFGNINSSTVSFFVDSIAPQIQFTAPTPANGSVITNSSFILNVSANDQNLATITLYIFNSSSLVNQTTINASGSLAYTLNDGVYFINASAYDTFGNINSTQTRTITIDSTSPSLTIYSPLNTSYINQNSILINISASDAQSIWFFNGTANESYTSPVIRYYGVGQHTLFAYANDSAGNINTSNVTFSVHSLSLSCEVGGPYQENSLVLVDGNLLFDSSGVSDTIVNISFISANYVAASAVTNTTLSGSYHYEISNLTAGSYLLNTSTIYQNTPISCTDNVIIGSVALLNLDRFASVYSVNATDIAYNVSLRLLNIGGSSALFANITDDFLESISIGNLTAGQGFDISYLRLFNRQNATYYAELNSSFAYATDAFNNSIITASTSVLNLSVPASNLPTQLLILKNIQFISQSSLNVTFNVSSTVYNIGGEVSNVVYTDSDINQTSFLFNLSGGESRLFDSMVIVPKAASNTVHTFSQGTAVVGALSFYSNIPSVSVPGYGGPADVIVYAPSSVSSGEVLDAVIQVVNVNPDIGQDFTTDYWITSSDEGVNYSSGQQTVYVGASSSTNMSVSLTAPVAAGFYRLRALTTWAGGTATSFDTFEVTITGGTTGGTGGGPGGGGGGGGGSSGGGRPSISGAVVTTPPGVVCSVPYIRHGAECCLDQNGNNICDSDEAAESPPTIDRAIPITGLAGITDVIFQRLAWSILLLVLSIILLIVLYLYMRRHRHNKDRGLVRAIIGLDVYTDSGVKLGRAYDIMIEGSRIYGIMIVVDPATGLRWPKVLVRYEYVRNITDVVLVSSRVLTNTQSTTG